MENIDAIPKDQQDNQYAENNPAETVRGITDASPVIDLGRQLRLAKKTMGILEEGNFVLVADLGLLTPEELSGLKLPLRDEKVLRSHLFPVKDLQRIVESKRTIDTREAGEEADVASKRDINREKRPRTTDSVSLAELHMQPYRYFQQSQFRQPPFQQAQFEQQQPRPLAPCTSNSNWNRGYSNFNPRKYEHGGSICGQNSESAPAPVAYQAHQQLH